MNHQDWTTVVIKSKPVKSGQQILRKGNYEITEKHTINHNIFKLDSNV